MLVGARKRSIYKLLMNILARGARTPYHESRCPEGLRPLLRQLNAVESEFHIVLMLMSPKNPLNHVDDVIKGMFGPLLSIMFLNSLPSVLCSHKYL